MRQLRILLLISILSGLYTISYSQGLETGIYSGVNFSDIHGQETGGKWSPKPGPVQGINVGYSFSRVLGIQSGITFSTIYYQHKSTSVYWPMIDYGSSSYYDYSSSSISPFYYPGSQQMDFRFIRIPLLLTITVPSELQLQMRGGIYYSRLKDFNLNYYSAEPVKHDFGYIFSSGISYPFSDSFKASFDINYVTGRTEFFENSDYRHGSTEFTLGLSYNWRAMNKNKKGAASSIKNDSLSQRTTVSYFGGLNYSWNKEPKVKGDYSGVMGPSIGFSVNFPIGKGAFFKTGFSFERKGYSLRDSSSSFYMNIQEGSPVMYDVDTKIHIDYGIIPALLSFPVGKSEHLVLYTGPWLGLKLNARVVGEAYNEYNTGGTYQYQKTTVYNDLGNAIKDSDAGWLFGCNASIPVAGNYEITIGLKYSTGFSDVYDSESIGIYMNPYSDSFGIRNSTLSFQVGITIPYKNR